MYRGRSDFTKNEVQSQIMGRENLRFSQEEQFKRDTMVQKKRMSQPYYQQTNFNKQIFYHNLEFMEKEVQRIKQPNVQSSYIDILNKNAVIGSSSNLVPAYSSNNRGKCLSHADDTSSQTSHHDSVQPRREQYLFEMEKRQFERSLEELSKKNIQLLNNEKQYKTVIERYKKELLMASLNTQNKLDQEVKEIKKNNKMQQEKIYTLQEEKKQIENKNQYLHQKYLHFQSELAEKQSIVKMSMKENHSYQEKIKTQREKQASLQIQCKKLNKQLQLLEKNKKTEIQLIKKIKLNQIQSLQRSYSEKITSLYQKLNLKEKRFNMLLEQFKNLNKKQDNSEKNKQQLVFHQKYKKQCTSMKIKQNQITLLQQKNTEYIQRIQQLEQQLNRMKVQKYKNEVMQNEMMSQKEENLYLLKIEINKLKIQNKKLSNSISEKSLSPNAKQKTSIPYSQKTMDKDQTYSRVVQRVSVGDNENIENECKILRKKINEMQFNVRKQVKLAQQKQQLLKESHQRQITQLNNQILELTMQNQLNVRNLNELRSRIDEKNELKNKDETVNGCRQQIARLKQKLVQVERVKNSSERSYQLKIEGMEREIVNLRVKVKKTCQMSDQIDHLWQVRKQQLANGELILREVHKQ